MSGSTGYRAASKTVALFRLGRTVVEVTGSRAIRVISGLTSNAVEGVQAGSGVYAFMLNPKGRVVIDMRVLPGPGFETAGVDAHDHPRAERETLWLDVPTVGLEALEEHLSKYVPPIFASYRPLEFDVISLIGPAAADFLTHERTDAEFAFSRDPAELRPLQAATIEGRDIVESGLIVRREDIEGPGFDLYVASVGLSTVEGALEAGVAAAGGTPGTTAEWHMLRIESGLPVYGRELGPSRLAQEAGQDTRAISFEKGCFTGQEVVARIHYRGHVNRHLRGLRVTELPDGPGAARWPDGAHPQPPAELPLTVGGKRVGTMTSPATSPRFGRIGLGYVRRELGAGAVVTCDAFPDSILEVVHLPFT